MHDLNDKRVEGWQTFIICGEMMRKCAKGRAPEVKAIHVGVFFDLTLVIYWEYIFGLGLETCPVSSNLHFKSRVVMVSIMQD